MSDDNFLSRWSRRKRESRDPPAAAPERPAAHSGAGVAGVPTAPTEALPGSQAPAVAPTPPVESLTPESDFSPFMREGIDPGLRREALKKLLRDPRFNVIDGLDVYIDDYSVADPLPEGWLGKLTQFAQLGDHGLSESESKASEQPPEGNKGVPDQAVASEPANRALDTSERGLAPPESKES